MSKPSNTKLLIERLIDQKVDILKFSKTINLNNHVISNWYRVKGKFYPSLGPSPKDNKTLVSTSNVRRTNSSLSKILKSKNKTPNGFYSHIQERTPKRHVHSLISSNKSIIVASPTLPNITGKESHINDARRVTQDINKILMLSPLKLSKVPKTLKQMNVTHSMGFKLKTKDFGISSTHKRFMRQTFGSMERANYNRSNIKRSLSQQEKDCQPQQLQIKKHP